MSTNKEFSTLQKIIFVPVIVILFIWALTFKECNKDEKTGLQYSFNTRNRFHGIFVGELVGVKEGKWRMYTFRSGSGNTITLGDFPDNSDNHLEISSEGEYMPVKNALKDSIDQTPSSFTGRILKVQWASISDLKNVFGNENGQKIVESISYPEVK